MTRRRTAKELRDMRQLLIEDADWCTILATTHGSGSSKQDRDIANAHLERRERIKAALVAVEWVMGIREKMVL